jgi:hypothetical protein
MQGRAPVASDPTASRAKGRRARRCDDAAARAWFDGAVASTCVVDHDRHGVEWRNAGG